MRTYRHTNFTNRALAAVGVLALTLTACGGDGTDEPAAADDPTATEAAAPADDADSPSDEDTGMDDMADDGTASDDMSDDMDDMDGMDDMAMSGDYGEPADPSEADRVIEVNVDNDLALTTSPTSRSPPARWSRSASPTPAMSSTSSCSGTRRPRTRWPR